MSALPSRCSFLILAAQRAGIVNPLAERAGVSHKCLVPIDGHPLIVHVARAIAATGCGGKLIVSVEPEAHDEVRHLLAPELPAGLALEFATSSPNIAESVIAAAPDEPWPLIITTADNVLLTPSALSHMIEALTQSDVVLNLASKQAVQAVHPVAQRNFYRFRDGEYSNCNLYGLAGPDALNATDAFREGGQFQKNPRRLISAFGLFNILLFRLKLVTPEQAAGRMSRRFGLTFRALILGDGSQAVDVDNERSFGIAEMVLQQRAAGAS